MHFVGGLPTTRKGHDFMFVIVGRFNGRVMIPFRNAISGKEATNLFFG